MTWAAFNRFEIEMTLEQARTGSHQGQCDEDVCYLSRLPEIAQQLAALDPAQVRAELKEYGAWDEAELADHTQNLQRVVWLAAGNITEEETA
jgi:hypothetical protein